MAVALLLLALLSADAQLLHPSHPKIQNSKPLHNPKPYVNLRSENADSLVDDGSNDVSILGINGKSGMIEINKKTGSSMFYWMMEKINGNVTNDDAPLVLWLQGGPGCSGMTGNFFEFGPLIVNDAGTGVERRNITWLDEVHLLFIDNPFGAGYSYAAVESDYVTDMDEMSVNLYQCLTDLMTMYPEWFNRDFYITGESFAGHYIPAISYYILKQEEALAKKLKGIAIGDGWTAPWYQVVYSDYAFAVGLIDEKEKANCQYYEHEAQSHYDWGSYVKAADAWNNVINVVEEGSGGANIYNYRIYGTYNTTNIDKYLNSTSTKELLHVPTDITFHDCDGAAYNALLANIFVSMESYLPYILDNIKVLLYNGQDDIIVNTPSAERWIKTIDWPGIKDYLEADKITWMNEGKVAGYARGYDNLQQVIVLKSGHMVPHDQIANSLNMLTRFIRNEGWN